MTVERIRELNKIANKLGYEICGAAYCKDCYDIYKINDESCTPEYADMTDAEVVEFIKYLLIQFEDLSTEGEYIAITDDGSKYEAQAVKNNIKPFCNRFNIMVYYCIPDYKDVIGFIKK